MKVGIKRGSSGRIRQIGAALGAATLLAVPMPVSAQGASGTVCQWLSEVTPEAVIRFTGSHGVGVSSGELLYRGRALMAIQQGQTLGYGSQWWSSADPNGAKGAVLVFAGVRQCAGPLASGRASQPQGGGC